MPLWEIDREKTESHWLQVTDAEEPNPGVPDAPRWRAVVKWDGCVHLWMPNDEYVHICELDDLIARLQELREKALVHYEGDWPG